MTKSNSPHTFYIPVMGTGFTIDTPLAVAKYGINSVISLVDDMLIEKMRKFWCAKANEPYQPITAQDKDARARRITEYLNLLQKLVNQQIAKIKQALFTPESELTNYFTQLPSGALQQKYQQMLGETDASKKSQLQDELRKAIVPGSIDVNIMTKLDMPRYHNGTALPYEVCDAASALRGYASSDLSSTVIFSAGFNPHLYGYAAKFADFYPDANNEFKKKICLKVSDYRSAAVQGKYLAKHGLWVSEYRIESALNCGGHAFINDGQLLAPILEEFKRRKDELKETLFGFYKKALESVKRFCAPDPYEVSITSQGGIGTSQEHEFLLQNYGLTAIGWGTPFLLVPEVVNVDTEHLQKLINAQENEVFLSASSPLGVPFWNLVNSASEQARLNRIAARSPGAICVKGYAKLNQEFTADPVCLASREYQTKKLQQLENSNLPAEQIAALKADVLSKSCICHDLAGGATLKNGIDNAATPAICPGPNIINFKKIASLKEMIGHIYGRCSLLVKNDRPHVFIREIQLQLNYLLKEIKNSSLGLPARPQQKLAEVKANLLAGIEYYQNLAKDMLAEQQEKFLYALQELQHAVEGVVFV